MAQAISPSHLGSQPARWQRGALLARTLRAGFTLIELLVVIGIAALLITMASTQFFGAMRQESVSKSRNQLRDVLLMARQQACILGTTQIVVCWNSDVEMKVGNKTEKATQGRFALFEYIGDVWKSGNTLYVPFGMQSEQFGTLKKGARAISLADPNASSFARITKVIRDANKRQEDIDTEIENRRRNIEFAYTVGGQSPAEAWKPSMYPIADFSGSLKELEKGRVPLAIRTSAAYSLPQYYAFEKDRTVFVFTPEGCLDTTSDNSIAAKHSVAGNSAKNATFKLSVSSEGVVTIAK